MRAPYRRGFPERSAASSVRRITSLGSVSPVQGGEALMDMPQMWGPPRSMAWTQASGSTSSSRPKTVRCSDSPWTAGLIAIRTLALDGATMSS